MAHILVIDDDVAFLAMLAQMLRQDGHRVTPAADGADALRLLPHSRPDLIVTDILMPNMDGIETMMQLSRQGDRTPVVAMSGGRRSVSAAFNLESAALLGVKATLAKPFSRADLRQAIEQALP